MKTKNLLLAILVIMIWSCQKDNDISDRNLCGDSVVINQTLYQQDSPDNFTVTNAFVAGDCVIVEIGASGCDPLNWQATLVTDGLETNSTPPSRMFRLKLVTNETCLASFTTEFTFYLGSENQTVIYFIDGWSGELIHNE